MQEVLMLMAAAFMGMSVYKTAALDEVTARHVVAALEVQGVHGEAAEAARTLLLDALGPMGGQGARGHKCLTFEINIEPPDRAACRMFHLNVTGTVEARINGLLCPKADGDWAEASGKGMISSVALDQRWRDMMLRTGAILYREPTPASDHNKFERPDVRVQVGGYVYREAQSFGLVRMPNGDTRYVLKSDLTPAEPVR